MQWNNSINLDKKIQGIVGDEKSLKMILWWAFANVFKLNWNRINKWSEKLCKVK